MILSTLAKDKTYSFGMRKKMFVCLSTLWGDKNSKIYCEQSGNRSQTIGRQHYIVSWEKLNFLYYYTQSIYLHISYWIMLDILCVENIDSWIDDSYSDPTSYLPFKFSHMYVTKFWYVWHFVTYFSSQIFSIIFS